MLARGIDGAAEAGFPADPAAAARAELWGVMVLGPISMNVVQALVQVRERASDPRERNRPTHLPHDTAPVQTRLTIGRTGGLDTLSLFDNPLLQEGARRAFSFRSRTN